jgi:hypothetical protein
MASRLNFGMICGMGIWLLRKTFPNLYSIFCPKDASIAAHLELSYGSMIGRWMFLPHSSGCCIKLE